MQLVHTHCMAWRGVVQLVHPLHGVEGHGAASAHPLHGVEGRGAASAHPLHGVEGRGAASAPTAWRGGAWCS